MTTATLELEKSELAVMGHEGDTKIIWSRDNDTEIAVARAAFDKLKKDGYTIYRTDKKGEASEKMDKFDPDAERLIAVPRVVGG